jgi:hypothetical protein
MKRLLKPKVIQGRDGWNFYKKTCNKKLRNKKIDRETYSKMVGAIYKEASDKLIENRSGVFLTGLGYFCIMMYPKRMMLRKKYSKTGEKFFNRETNNYPYSPQWIHTMYRSRFSYWTMDRSFSEKKIRKPLAEKLKSGKKYVMEYELVRSLEKLKTKRKE